MDDLCWSSAAVEFPAPLTFDEHLLDAAHQPGVDLGGDALKLLDGVEAIHLHRRGTSSGIVREATGPVAASRR